jgi:hypothetical protein
MGSASGEAPPSVRRGSDDRRYGTAELGRGPRLDTASPTLINVFGLLTLQHNFKWPETLITGSWEPVGQARYRHGVRHAPSTHPVSRRQPVARLGTRRPVSRRGVLTRAIPGTGIGSAKSGRCPAARGMPRLPTGGPQPESSAHPLERAQSRVKSIRARRNPDSTLRAYQRPDVHDQIANLDTGLTRTQRAERRDEGPPTGTLSRRLAIAAATSG